MKNVGLIVRIFQDIFTYKKNAWHRDVAGERMGSMGVSTDQISNNKIVRYARTTKSTRCLSCGADLAKPRRRYCSNKCRKQLDWVLSLSKGLLRAFSARYAAFFFTDNYVILDVLPVWSKVISRFVFDRTLDNKPAEDLKNLILDAGEKWHQQVGDNKSKSYASLFLLDKNYKKDIDLGSIKPNRKNSPRLSRQENACLKALRLDRKDLCADGHVVKINSAYRRMAKVHHPDRGGDTEKFKQLNEAHKQMLLWAEKPQYISRKALQDCWSYDASTNRWSPPL